jgi:hypothetical protein
MQADMPLQSDTSTTFPPRPLHSAEDSFVGDILVGRTGATTVVPLSTARAEVATIEANKTPAEIDKHPIRMTMLSSEFADVHT